MQLFDMYTFDFSTLMMKNRMSKWKKKDIIGIQTFDISGTVARYSHQLLPLPQDCRHPQGDWGRLQELLWSVRVKADDRLEENHQVGLVLFLRANRPLQIILTAKSKPVRSEPTIIYHYLSLRFSLITIMSEVPLKLINTKCFSDYQSGDVYLAEAAQILIQVGSSCNCSYKVDQDYFPRALSRDQKSNMNVCVFFVCFFLHFWHPRFLECCLWSPRHKETQFEAGTDSGELALILCPSVNRIVFVYRNRASPLGGVYEYLFMHSLRTVVVNYLMNVLLLDVIK